MASSMAMCLQALGYENVDEDTVNRVMGAKPMQGASWEDALACAQHYGCRATLVVPATISMIKAWTDAGTPVMIAWNPEGRDWSHASCVYDVTDALPKDIPDDCVVVGEGSGPYVWVADPNIPHPQKTTRIVQADHFYKTWAEKWPRYMVRRPALAIEREITKDGRQVVAGDRETSRGSSMPVNARFDEGKPADPTENMTEAQRAEWWEHHEKNKDKFKAATIRLASLAGGQARATELTRLMRVAQSVDTFKVRARAAHFSSTAVEFCLQHLAVEKTDTEAKFEEGKPADPTENMTEEQKKEWWAHHEKNKDQFKAAAEDEEDEPSKDEGETSKEAAGGLYGYTKATQRDVDAAIRKIERQAAKLARSLWDKDERAATFLASHSRRASSTPARILAAALNGFPSSASNQGVTAGGGEHGLYGFPARTARLGLNACAELRDFAGRVAFDLHQRRTARYEHITGYLKSHTKAAKCRYSRLLLDSYPDAPPTQTANSSTKKASVPSTVSGWLEWE